MTNEGSPVRHPIEIVSSDGEVVLRQFTPQDAEDIFSLIDNNRGHLSQFGDDTAEKYPTLESVRKSIEEPSNPNRLRFAIRNKAGVFVGSINITPEGDDPKTAEIGYYLGSEFQGKGYMGRAVESLTNYGFETLSYESIYGDVVGSNETSINVLLRAGYKEISRQEGKIRFTKQK
ncbi:MAG: GNAT family N-acetyltransferase [Candidatus Levybacteria bacterium]|nr:GNAT family N-acetyltransferase [Candidatus Levybacteria bacterium]